MRKNKKNESNGKENIVNRGGVIEKIVSNVYYVGLATVITVLFFLFCISENPQISLIGIGLMLLILMLFRSPKLRHHIHAYVPDERTPIVLFIITFITRYSHCVFMQIIAQVHQVSDFAITLEEAQSGLFTDRLSYYRLYLHKFLYPFLLHALNLTTQERIFFFQSICLSFTSIVLFYIGSKIANKKVGMVSALIYIFWPAQIVYSSVVTEEHIAVLVTALIVLMTVDIYQRITKIDNIKSQEIRIIVIEAACIGINCGICAFFKDWASIIIVAAIICSMYLLAFASNSQRIVIICSLGLIILGRFLTSNGLVAYAENKLGVEGNNGVVIIQMYETLDPDSDGKYNVELNTQYAQMAEANNYDYDLTNKMAIKILSDKIKKGYNKMPTLLLNKGKNAFSNNSNIFSWAFLSEVDTMMYNQLAGWYLVYLFVDIIIYVMVVLGIIISAVFGRNRGVYFILLCIAGGIMAILLVESQGRYKYSMEMIWTIPAAYSFYILINSRIAKH